MILPESAEKKLELHCVNCGYRLWGNVAPEVCPQCGKVHTLQDGEHPHSEESPCGEEKKDT